jgi:intracellular sulfur oxidation DsrE/DsrF family protein
MNSILFFITILATLGFNASSMASESAPWGYAGIEKRTYQKQKVIYDLFADNKDKISNILSRAGYLSKLNGDDSFEIKIVIIIHGDAIPFFSVKKFEQHRELMKLAYSQTLNGTVEFKMCQASARLRGFEANDIHGFVSMVPMADTEIVRLQQAGYAYMQ